MANNAGWTHRNKPLLEVPGEEFDRVFTVNVRSIFLMTQAAVPVMKRQGGGMILNIGSTAGIRPRPGPTWYNGSKGAVNLMSRSMPAELAPDRIRVNCVAPVIGAINLLEPLMGVRTCRTTGQSSSPRSRSVASRSRRTSPTPGFIWRRATRIS
ncbi:SDR family NAD(P)-dependent oxidoreductase [Azospirillum thiophilum]|uniref:SDR family NAD(P)-dependent oxidoreductase n=1 Tax=Azospirillum thiophilum TaxID=528244 RepID=UPI000AEDB95D